MPRREYRDDDDYPRRRRRFRDEDDDPPGKSGPMGPGDYWNWSDGVLIRSSAGPRGARTNFAITPTCLQN